MKRVPAKRKVRDTVLIATNGRQTEKNYFSCLTEHFKSIYSIKIEFRNMQCDELVNYAASLNQTDYNQIWCVFDVDDTVEEGHLLTALKVARASNIRVAISNEAFEVWLLFHLCPEVKPSLTRKSYAKEINRLLSEQGEKAIYRKNDIELLKTAFLPNALDAAENAKKVYQKKEAEYQRQFGNSNFRIWEWKSITTVYKLIESLRLTEK